MIKKRLFVVILAACAFLLLQPQDFPVWERILKHYSGTSDETPVPIDEDGAYADVAEG